MQLFPLQGAGINWNLVVQHVSVHDGAVVVRLAALELLPLRRHEHTTVVVVVVVTAVVVVVVVVGGTVVVVVVVGGAAVVVVVVGGTAVVVVVDAAVVVDPPTVVVVVVLTISPAALERGMALTRVTRVVKSLGAVVGSGALESTNSTLTSTSLYFGLVFSVTVQILVKFALDPLPLTAAIASLLLAKRGSS